MILPVKVPVSLQPEKVLLDHNLAKTPVIHPFVMEMVIQKLAKVLKTQAPVRVLVDPNVLEKVLVSQKMVVILVPQPSADVLEVHWTGMASMTQNLVAHLGVGVSHSSNRVPELQSSEEALVLVVADWFPVEDNAEHIPTYSCSTISQSPHYDLLFQRLWTQTHAEME